MALLRLKEILAEKGISSKYLAEKVEVTPATISNINSGNQFPKEELLLKICQVLDVDVKDLFHSIKTETGNYSRPIFVEENGKFIKIGEIKVDDLNSDQSNFLNKK